MSIELTWLVPDQILLSCWTDVVTEDDMRVLVEELIIIFDAADRLIHSVIDLAAVRSFNDAAIYLYYQSPAAKHPRRGRIAVVKPPLQGQIMADVLNRVAQRELVRLFDTREDARDFLLTNDSPPPVYYSGYDQPAEVGSD